MSGLFVPLPWYHLGCNLHWLPLVAFLILYAGVASILFAYEATRHCRALPPRKVLKGVAVLFCLHRNPEYG